MERKIEHDKDGKLMKMIKKKSCGIKSIKTTFRTINFDVQYVNSYSCDSYIKITPRYEGGLERIANRFLSNFSKSSNPPKYCIDDCYYCCEHVDEIRKQNPNTKIEKIRIYTYEQLEFFLKLEQF